MPADTLQPTATMPPADAGRLEASVGRPVPERADVGEPMTEGELWSFLRSVMSQGADIRCDYEAGRHQGYEAYSARLDAAASERAEQLWARLKTPNVEFSGVPAGHSSNHPAGGTSAGTQG